jgi:hypothetical protein
MPEKRVEMDYRRLRGVTRIDEPEFAGGLRQERIGRRERNAVASAQEFEQLLTHFRKPFRIRRLCVRHQVQKPDAIGPASKLVMHNTCNA